MFDIKHGREEIVNKNGREGEKYRTLHDKNKYKNDSLGDLIRMKKYGM